VWLGKEKRTGDRGGVAVDDVKRKKEEYNFCSFDNEETSGEKD
jgi:hypothetical protein